MPQGHDETLSNKQAKKAPLKLPYSMLTARNTDQGQPASNSSARPGTWLCRGLREKDKSCSENAVCVPKDRLTVCVVSLTGGGEALEKGEPARGSALPLHKSLTG